MDTLLDILLIGVGERAGSGVPEIYEVWEKEGLDKPMVEEQFGADVPDRTKLTLPLTKKLTIKSGDKKATIKSDDKKATINNDDKKITQKSNCKFTEKVTDGSC